MKNNTHWMFFCFCLFLNTGMVLAQGNYVFAGSEAVNYGEIRLSTPGGQTWGTARSATPGYFSVAIGGMFSGAADTANINGYVKKYGNELFIFPVGNGTDLRTIGISAPASATDAYATAWIFGHPSTTADPTNASALHDTSAVSGSILRVMPVGQWDWQAISGTGAGLTVTASMPDLSGFSAPGHLRLVGWDHVTAKWVPLGSTGATANTENTTISGTMAASIDAVSIGSITNGFPDLSPSSKIANATFTASVQTSRDLVVEVNEILANITDAANKVIQVRVSKSSNFTYTFDPTTTSVNAPLPTSVNNNLWDLVSNTSTAMTFQLKAGNEINASTKLNFSVQMKVLTTAAKSSLNINIGVIANSGGEVDIENNNVVRKISIQ